MSIGERIAQLLKLQGKMAKDLAEFLGISASSVTGWTHGSYPSSQHIIKISEFFDVSANYILTGEEADYGTSLSPDGLRVGKMWDDLDERGKTIILAKIYERQEVIRVSAEDAAPDEGLLKKEA